MADRKKKIQENSASLEATPKQGSASPKPGRVQGSSKLGSKKSPVKKGPSSGGKRVVKAGYKDANSSPQKMRLVANLIRGKNADEAINILNFTNKKAAKTLLKVLNSAIANSDNQYGVGVEKLYISSIEIGDGIKLPRYRFASRGRICRLSKRRSLINIELTEK
jgi:large subunit ribosomal protein L22